MAVGDFDTFYGSNPWAGITTKERLWYDPMLRDVYRKKAVFGRFASFKQNLADRNAKTMQITSLYDIHPNTNALGLRDEWLPAAHVDSRSLQITFSRFGGKVAYHMYDEIITYWQQGGSTASVLRSIINAKLGQHITDVQDLLARNAFLSAPYQLYPGVATNFNTIGDQDKMSTALLREIHLGMQYRDVPYASGIDGNIGNIVCITSPGVLFDIQNQTDPRDWLTPMAYADPSRLLNYEVGTYQNVRFVSSPKATLFNCGPKVVQTTVTSAISAGDGAPSTVVDGTYTVGQPGATHYIQLDSGTDMTQFALNDIVTVHTARTNANGVTNGVDFTDGTLSNRRIVNINSGSQRLSFEEPIMLDMNTDLGGGVYAYVTKGKHIHSSIFIGGDDGVVMGVGRPPRLHTPPPVDDFDSIYRFSWDSYQGYSIYNPRVLEVVFSAGSFRQVGAMLPLQG